MASKGPTATLCEWVCSTRYEDIPSEVRQEALKVLYDEVGCMVAGSTIESVKPVVDLVRKLGGAGECTVVGHSFRAPVLNAALANGTIGHADEVDPTSVHGAGHFAATMVPTALTAGQYTKASGKDFARAFVLGAEVAARMQSGINQNDEDRPEFYYSAGAALGAAVTTGLLLGLDADKMEHALGAAAMSCAPLMSLHQEPLHQAKSLAFSGRTARAGVESALLAQHGFHGPREILTTENGFFHAFTGKREVGHETVADLGKKYVMKDLLYKRYAAGGPNLAPLYAFFQLMKQHQFTPDDIEYIEVTGARSNSAGITNQNLQINTVAVLSIAACYGEYTFKNAHDPSYRTDPRYLAFQKRTKVTVVPLTGKGSTDRAHRLDAGMTVRTRKGEFSQKVSYPLMTQEEIEQKFRTLVGLRLDQARTTELERKLKGLESLDNVATLVSDLELAK